MKIHLRNLGPIQGPVEFDLKPLTILVGPNNSGKTWLAYTFAGIFGSYGLQTAIQGQGLEKISQDLTKVIDGLLATGAASLDLCQFAANHSEAYFNTIVSQAPIWLSSFLNTQNASFSGLKFSITLGETQKRIHDRILASSLYFSVSAGQASTLMNFWKKEGESNLYIYATSKIPIEKQLPKYIIQDILQKEVIQTLHRSLYLDVTTLPTERTTIVTLPPTTLAQMMNSSEEEYKQSSLAKMGNLSWPIIHYIYSVIIAAYSVGPQEKAAREKEEAKIPEIKEYSRLADLLEQQILEGKIDFSLGEPGPGRKILFQPTGGTALEISIASSMVKELAPLVLYLRYFAKPGELLIIDEPEMNLHPRAQAQILELLAMLVNSGLQVIMTTHSPYIIDHISNLYKANESSNKEAIRSEFFLHDEQAFLPKERASVYLLDHGTIVDAMSEEVEEDTFGKITDVISDIYFKL